MTESSSTGVAKHNQGQREYFERSLKRTMVPSGSPYLRRHVDEALRFAGYRSTDRVLEVGCGMGRYTLILAERGVDVEGLDLSPVLLERLAAYGAGKPQVKLHCADILEPPAELEGAFDLVLGFFVLHHLYALGDSFAGMRKTLKPGGRMVFVEPNPYNPLYYVQMALTPGMMWRGDGGIVRMRRGPIFRALGEAGLLRPRLARFGFFPPFVANQAWAPPLEAALERVPIWRSSLPFQLIGADCP